MDHEDSLRWVSNLQKDLGLSENQTAKNKND